MKKINQEIIIRDQEKNEMKILIGINSWQKKIPIEIISASQKSTTVSECGKTKRSLITITTGVKLEKNEM